MGPIKKRKSIIIFFICQLKEKQNLVQNHENYGNFKGIIGLGPARLSKNNNYNNNSVYTTFTIEWILSENCEFCESKSKNRFRVLKPMKKLPNFIIDEEICQIDEKSKNSQPKSKISDLRKKQKIFTFMIKKFN